MRVIPYSPEIHRSQVDAWCDARGMNPFPPGWLPTVGFFVDGVACMWVYRTDSLVMIVENVISNPATTKEVRAEAISAIQAAIEAHARDSSIKYLIGQSSNPSLLEHARTHGYVVTSEIQQIIKVL